MTVCPESIEIGMNIYWTTSICVIIFTVFCKHIQLFPCFTFVPSFPHVHFTSCVIRLWPHRGWGDDSPSASFAHIDRSSVVIIARGGNVMNYPLFPIPPSRMPHPRLMHRSGQWPFTCNIQDNRTTFFVEVQVSNIHVTFF